MYGRDRVSCEKEDNKGSCWYGTATRTSTQHEPATSVRATWSGAGCGFAKLSASGRDGASDLGTPGSRCRTRCCRVDPGQHNRTDCTAAKQPQHIALADVMMMSFICSCRNKSTLTAHYTMPECERIPAFFAATLHLLCPGSPGPKWGLALCHPSSRPPSRSQRCPRSAGSFSSLLAPEQAHGGMGKNCGCRNAPAARCSARRPSPTRKF